MSDGLSSLGEEELDRLLQLIESLERSPFDFLQLEMGGMKVVLGKGSPNGDGGADRLGASANARVTATDQPATDQPATDQPAAPAEPDTLDGTLEIRAPMVGIFYAQAEPGGPPYVTVGSSVQADTTVALVEVMKMFNAVPAGVEGTVVAVLVENSQLVEYGQPLFRVRPS